MGSRRPSSPSVALGLAALLLTALLVTGPRSPNTLTSALPIAALIAITAALWLHRRERQRTQQTLHRHAMQRALAHERLAIARELHDIISNGLAVIAMRASTATLCHEQDPEALITALREIERVSRATTQDLRQMLKALRDDQPPAAAPPTLADINLLASALQHAGVSVELDGLATPVHSPAVSLTLYRVVQEAFANTVRHAGPTSSKVSIGRRSDTVVLEVVDEGPAPGWRDMRGTGLGLAGLRERVSVLGGTLTVGPHAHGFALRAVLPDPPASDHE